MKLPLTLFLFCCTLSSLATTFTVTSNADSGPGTLRDALTQAAANGQATTDIITFNIADQSQAGRTIALLSALPDLSSNLTLDGTTEAAPVFGISNARIELSITYPLQYIPFFEAIGQTNITVYGLFLQGGGTNLGFHLQASSNIQIGAAGSGNVIDGCSQVVYCDVVFYSDAGCSNLTIQGNFLGINPTGSTTGFALNGVTFYLTNVSNLQIGGLNPGQGNNMVDQEYPMNYSCMRSGNFGYLNIQGNTEGTDLTGTARLAINLGQFMISGFDDGAANVTGTTPIAVNITGNVSASSFDFFDISSPIIIQGNHIGVGLDNITNLTGLTSASSFPLLDFDFCGSALVGGTAVTDKNYLAYGGYGVYEFWCSNITLSRNSFFCNSLGIEFNWMLAPRPVPFVNITLLTTGEIGGTALPGSTVELFYDDECPGCEGKTYIGATTADGNGNWTYTLTATGAIVATATDTYGATSAFSTATINTDNIVVQNATCGRNNGSIRNIQVTSGTEWYWQDAQGNIVANSVDLTNAGPGTYTFVTSIGGASCSASSTPYTITNVNLPTVNINDITVTQPSCGQNNGAFQYSGAFDPTAAYVWLKGTDIVCPDYTASNPLTNLAPGAYTLQVTLVQDPTCFAQYGPIPLANQTGPSLTTDALQITPTTCGNANGSINGITYQNSTGAIYLGWEDSTGHTVSNSLNLTNVVAGLYRLAFKDAGGCDTIFTVFYRISDNGSITYDTSQMVISPASCNALNGAITGITSINATTYNWISIANGAPAGSAENLTGLGAGSYQLQFSNAYGCQAQTPALVVAQIDKPAFDYSALQVQNDTCNSGQGAIKDLKMVDQTSTYTWEWFNNSQVVGSTAGLLAGLHAGDYYADVTDQYQCSVNSNTFNIQDIQLAPPAPQVSDQYIPRNTSTIVIISNPQTGTYELLDNDASGANVLATSNTDTLTTPIITEDETLYVRFTRGDCVSSSSPLNIKVFDSVKLFVPNAFTPDKGANNRWHIIAQGLVNSIHIAVFDRWGAEVFAGSNINASWDGTFGGHPVSGTFVYIIVGTDYYNRPFRFNGTILVIR
jgi:gliding motility-associated-like protein